MILCGIVGAASIGAASAATTDDDVPSITVRYNPQSLDTESGAERFISRLVKAAVEVCPQSPNSTLGSAMQFAIAASRRSREPCSRSTTRGWRRFMPPIKERVRR